MKTERHNKITECLSPYFEQMFYERSRDTLVYFHENKEIILHSFLSAVTSACDYAYALTNSRKKQQIKYLQFSFLFSGALMNERQLKIDLYDARYYADVTETGGFWDYSVLFPYVDKDIEVLYDKLTNRVLRVKDYELIDLRIVYHIGIFAIMEEILKELTKEKLFIKALTDIFEPKVYVVYGAYLDQSKLITTIIRS